MTRAEDIRGWRDRWFGVRPADVESIRADLLAGRPVTTNVFGEAGGRIDLRGLPLTRLKVQRTTAGGEGQGTWEGLDLSGADLYEMNWMRLTVRDCVLDDADIEDLRCWGLTVEDSSLRRARLGSGQLGAAKEFWPTRSRWRRVDLSQADLRGAHADAEFTQVNFRNAKLRGMNFRWSDLDDCVFAGVLHNVTIGFRHLAERPPNWRLSGVDLTAAKPRELNLVCVDLGQSEVDIRLPEDAEHWIVRDWPDYCERVRQAILALPKDGELRMVAEIWHDQAVADSGPQQTAGFVAAWDLKSLGGQELVDFLNEAL